MEFFIYHDIADCITSSDQHYLFMEKEFYLGKRKYHAPRGSCTSFLSGVFILISRTRRLREKVRHRCSMKWIPSVDSHILFEAVKIESAIHRLASIHPDKSARQLVSLYKKCALLYLHRTVSPQTSQLRVAVEQGLHLLRMFPSDRNTQSRLVLPLVVLSLCAFDDLQRRELHDRFHVVYRLSRRGSVNITRKAVEQVWRTIDQTGDCWDWVKFLALNCPHTTRAICD